jgi:hypothetical protein
LKTYSISANPFHAGYDADGNLFVDALTTANDYELLELQAQGGSFQSVSLPHAIASVTSVQWDGSYITVTDADARKIYRYAVSDFSATLEGTVSFKGSNGCDATWIATSYVFCSERRMQRDDVYAYPAGGKPIASLEGDSGGSIVQVSK